MIAWFRSARKWLWAFVLGVLLVVAGFLAARARGRQDKHDRRLSDLQDNQSADRNRKITSEVEAARKAGEAAKKRKEHVRKVLDGLAKVDPDMADTLSRYNTHRVPERPDPAGVPERKTRD